MKTIKVSAPGKLHLLGEHAVGYGKPALLAAVNKRVFVEIKSRKDNKTKIIFKKIHGNKLSAYINHAIDTTLNFYKQKLPSGITISISSEIPIGSGMGSSAASAVAIAGAITLFLGNKFDKKKINEIAYLIEHYSHGNPSGGDNSTSCFGGFVWYQKKSPDKKVIKSIPLKFSKKIADNFFTIDTGKPRESTKEMVSVVNKLAEKKPKFVQKIFNDQEKLVKNLLSALKKSDENEIIQILKNGEKNLEELGVVSPYVQKIIRKIENAGGAAKICGGGGQAKATGILLVYCRNKIDLSHDKIQLGTDGVRYEK